jgi:uncharacterized protein (DUF1778 family)
MAEKTTTNAITRAKTEKPAPPVTRSKGERVEVRATPAQVAVIKQAAAVCGWTVTRFVLDTVVERAEEILREERALTLPNEVFDRFIAALDGPAQTVPQLVDLFGRPSPIPPP